MEEIWKDIEGYEGLYQVSNLGRVRSVDRIIAKRNRWGNTRVYLIGVDLKPQYNRDGYATLVLRRKKLFVHRLVAEVFCEKSEGAIVVDHINTIRTDNRAENLRWCTREENSRNPLTKQHLSTSLIGNTRNKGRKFPEEWKKKISDSVRCYHASFSVGETFFF